MASGAFSAPPSDGTVSLPETIDFHRTHNPTRPMYVYNQDGSVDATATEITHLEFGRACDRVAHFLRPGRKGLIEEREVVALLALSDTVFYQAVTMGIMRAGMIPYPMSPRNTAEVTIKLLKDSSCHRLLTTKETLRSLINEIQIQLASTSPEFILSVEEVPPLLKVYPKLGHETVDDPFEPYPTAPRPSMDDTVMYLHSSGSTGLPKTIPHTFTAMVHWASFPPVTDLRDYGKPVTFGVMALPPFHTLGIYAHLLIPLYGLVVASLYPPTATTPKSLPFIPTPQNIVDHLKRTKCNSVVIVPALLQLWSHDEEVVQLLSSLEFVVYAGGSLPSKIGNAMTEAGVKLCSIYGATEFAAPTHYFRGEGDENEWDYVRFSTQATIRWIPQGDGTYECQFLTSETHCISVENISDVRGYATSDLFVAHPTKDYFWKAVGRKDDVIIHTSGEKTVPGPMEDVIMSSPYVMGVVIFGREHDQAGVLVELKPSYAIDVKNEQRLIEARNLLWPIVDEANNVAPAFSRVFKELILIASQDKALPRTGKGSIMRKAALSAYHDEIQEIYAKVDATVQVEAVRPPAFWTVEGVQSWLVAQIAEITSGKSFLVNDDLFEQGLDSLGATILRRRIVGALQAPELRLPKGAAQLITQLTIYDNPTISKLARFLVDIVVDPDNCVAAATSGAEAIERMISKYAGGTAMPGPELENSTSAPPLHTNGVLIPEGLVVLITGTTGNLGSQILEGLLRDQRIQTVYTLNRPSASGLTVEERHTRRFADKGFDVNLLSSPKIVSLEGDSNSHRNLGLEPNIYDEANECSLRFIPQIRDRIDVVIHNAWKLDFNLPLSSFEPHLQGTRNLIDLARTSRHASSLKFLFTSSVTAAYSWDKAKGRVPDDVLPDARYAVGNGYGEGKYVAERMLSTSGLQATSFRIGQISGGAPNGAWSTTDWVPILIKSSVHLGVLPSAVGTVSWLPMHAVSQAILDVALASESQVSPLAFPPALNVVHPRPVPWNLVFSYINDALVQQGVVNEKLPVVEFKKWFGFLQARVTSPDVSAKTIEDVPAIKLLEFFRSMAHSTDIDTASAGEEAEGEVGGLASFSTKEVQTRSKTMAQLPSLSAGDAALWVRYWKNVGLFKAS